MTSSCNSANACNSSRLAAARSAASSSSAPHNQPRYMNVDRTHLPPARKSRSTSDATPIPAVCNSGPQCMVTKSSMIANTAPRVVLRQRSPRGSALVLEAAAVRCRVDACTRVRPSIAVKRHPYPAPIALLYPPAGKLIAIFVVSCTPFCIDCASIGENSASRARSDCSAGRRKPAQNQRDLGSFASVGMAGWRSGRKPLHGSSDPLIGRRQRHPNVV